MKRPARRPSMQVWLIVSVLLHASLLTLPASLIELVFPAKSEVVSALPADLTPDFEEIAIGVITVSREPLSQDFQMRFVEEAAPTVVSEPSPPPGAQPGLPQQGGGGDSGLLADTRFFPPVPRLIVPPEIDEVGVSTISIDIRILVGVDGYPIKVELPDSLIDSEIGRKLLESATRFRFEPARMGDLPVESWVSLPLELEASLTR